MRTEVTVLILAASLALPMAVPDALAAGRRVQRTDTNKHYRQPNTMGGKTVLIPIGTTFEGRIDQTLSSTRSHAGQSFVISLSSPVLANGVDVVIPAGSKVLGEVVEAVPASRVPYRRKVDPKPRGKLRVQLTGLQTPDGITHPMVCSLLGEVGGRSAGRRTPIGTGVAYMGSAASFEAVRPGSNARERRGQAPKVVTRREMLKDTLYGLDPERRNNDASIRSLVLKKRDYFIYEGSPLTVRLDAPFKMGVTPQRTGVDVTALDEPIDDEELPAATRKRTLPVQAPPSQGLAPDGTVNPSAPMPESMF